MKNPRLISSVLMAAILALAVAGCTTRSPELPASSSQKSNLTPGMVEATVKNGETRQVDVLQTFGAPNIVTRDQAGREVWTYDVHSVAHASASTERSGSLAAAGAGLAGEALVGGAGGVSGGKSTSAGQVSSSTFTLMITFDENDVVQDYRMMSTQF